MSVFSHTKQTYTHPINTEHSCEFSSIQCVCVSAHGDTRPSSSPQMFHPVEEERAQQNYHSLSLWCNPAQSYDFVWYFEMWTSVFEDEGVEEEFVVVASGGTEDKGNIDITCQSFAYSWWQMIHMPYDKPHVYFLLLLISSLMKTSCLPL